MGVAIFISYRWMEEESAGDIKFDCECGKRVEREQANIYDVIECKCGIKYKLHVAVYVKKIESEAPEKKT